MVNGTPATVDLKKLGNSGIYSASIRFDGPLPKNLEDSLPAKWAIRGTGGENVIETSVFFED